jgi:hypothetical protein
MDSVFLTIKQKKTKFDLKTPKLLEKMAEIARKNARKNGRNVRFDVFFDDILIMINILAGTLARCRCGTSQLARRCVAILTLF